MISEAERVAENSRATRDARAIRRAGSTGRRRTADDRDRRSAQALRRAGGGEGRLAAGRPRRGTLHHRAERLRQVDVPALHQPAGGADARAHAGRRDQHDVRGGGKTAVDASAGRLPRPIRHGVPAVPPVSAHDRARKRHERPAHGEAAAACQARGHRRQPARQGRAGGETRCLPKAPLGWPGAAGRHRPRARHGARGGAVRRGAPPRSTPSWSTKCSPSSGN